MINFDIKMRKLYQIDIHGTSRASCNSTGTLGVPYLVTGSQPLTADQSVLEMCRELRIHVCTVTACRSAVEDVGQALEAIPIDERG